MRDKPTAGIDDLSSQRFYHGTKADLKSGDLIEPGYNSNYGKMKQAAYVYLTATLNAATWGPSWPSAKDPAGSHGAKSVGKCRLNGCNKTNKSFKLTSLRAAA